MIAMIFNVLTGMAFVGLLFLLKDRIGFEDTVLFALGFLGAMVATRSDVRGVIREELAKFGTIKKGG